LNPTIALERNLERKTGIHTIDETPPSKKTKTTQMTPQATGLHTLASSDTNPRAQPSKVSSKKGLHTLADVSDGHNSTRRSLGGSSLATNDEDDGDYVEDGAKLESDDDDLVPGVSNGAPGTKESNDVHSPREHQIGTEGLRLGTKSQSKEVIRHREATRAKLMFLERLSQGTDKAVGKAIDAGDGGNGAADEERDTGV
jgi:hypothetical protein